MYYLRKDWLYLTWKKYLYIDITFPKKTMNKLKGVFKPLVSYFKFNKDNYAPWPVLWVSEPAFIQIVLRDVGWKDKYDTPRFEYPPYIWIHIYKWNLVWYWSLPIYCSSREDEYWGQALWYLYYYHNSSQGLLNKPDIKKAKESWPWQDMKGISTWSDKFLTK